MLIRHNPETEKSTLSTLTTMAIGRELSKSPTPTQSSLTEIGEPVQTSVVMLALHRSGFINLYGRLVRRKPLLERPF